MPPKRLPANRFGALADDGNTASSQHTASVEQVKQYSIEAMDTSPDAPPQSQSVGDTSSGTTDAPTRTEETQSDEVMEDNTYLGSGLANSNIVQSSADEPLAQTNSSQIVMGDLRQVNHGIPLILQEAPTVTAVNPFVKRKPQSAVQGSAQKKPRTEADLPTHFTLSNDPKIDPFAKFRKRKPPKLLDFHKVQSPEKTFCRVMAYSDVSDIEEAPHVGALFSVPEDVSVRMYVDAGRYGTPEVRLRFKIAGENTSHKTFWASWRPGVSDTGEFMVDHLDWMKMTDEREGTFPNYKQVYADAREDDSDRVERIVTLILKCNYTKATDVDYNQIEKLTPAAREVLTRIFCNSKPYTLALWFVARPSLEVARDQWLPFLEHAFNHRLPPR